MLPVIIFMRVCVVGNTADNNARELGKQPGSFHLEAKDIANFTDQRGPLGPALYDPISGCDETIMNFGVGGSSRLPSNNSIPLAPKAGRLSNIMRITRVK
jgi:hypothetical protein